MLNPKQLGTFGHCHLKVDTSNSLSQYGLSLVHSVKPVSLMFTDLLDCPIDGLDLIALPHSSLAGISRFSTSPQEQLPLTQSFTPYPRKASAQLIQIIHKTRPGSTLTHKSSVCIMKVCEKNNWSFERKEALTVVIPNHASYYTIWSSTWKGTSGNAWINTVSGHHVSQTLCNVVSGSASTAYPTSTTSGE
jgi:hypothetical protein